MATEDDLRKRLVSILENADLNIITPRMIRKQLEDEFNCNLADKKSFIKEEVQIFLEQREEVKHSDNDNSALLPSTSAQVGEADEKPTTQPKKRSRKTKEAEEEDPEGKTRKGTGGLNKVCLLSPELSALFGVSEMPRTEIVKEVWKYIRSHNLQDPSNKRKINCDETLAHILGTDSTDMFQMNKYLARHIFSKAEDGQPEKKAKPAKPTTGPVSQFRIDQPLSEALQEFLGTGESHLPRQEVVRRMWAYIKENNLQDPSDKRRILCDERMQKFLQVESFNGFGITKLLSPHIGIPKKLPSEEEEEGAIAATAVAGGAEEVEEVSA